MWISAAVLSRRAALVCAFLAPGEPDGAVAPAALVGCRAPDEPNCSRCCLAAADDDACEYLVGEVDWSLYDDVEPWYNEYEVSDGACPADCPRCARCSERDERELRALEPRPECDCATLTIGIDPCYSPDSCACHCRTLESLLAMCPPADETTPAARERIR